MRPELRVTGRPQLFLSLATSFRDLGPEASRGCRSSDRKGEAGAKDNCGPSASRNPGRTRPVRADVLVQKLGRPRTRVPGEKLHAKPVSLRTRPRRRCAQTAGLAPNQRPMPTSRNGASRQSSSTITGEGPAYDTCRHAAATCSAFESGRRARANPSRSDVSQLSHSDSKVCCHSAASARICLTL